MKSDEEILEIGCAAMGEGSCRPDSGIVMMDGCMYPFHGERMTNPLDPVELLISVPHGGRDYDSDNTHELSCVNRILSTLEVACDLRKRGFTVITKYKNGAPKTILMKDDDKVLILGDLAKQQNLILHILSTQIAEDYDQSVIPCWKERGFRTPPKYWINKVENEYVTDNAFAYGEQSVTYYNVKGPDGEVTVKLVYYEGTSMEVSDDDDRCFDEEAETYEYFEVTDKRIKTTPFHRSTPSYVWQDKGDADEG